MCDNFSKYNKLKIFAVLKALTLAYPFKCYIPYKVESAQELKITMPNP